MPDREKVIKGLEYCIKDIDCTGCPYEQKCFDDDDDRQYGEDMMRDALALLKEQETTDTNKSRIFHCEKCGYGIEDIYLSDEENYQIDPAYCPNCGRMVKRDV